MRIGGCAGTIIGLFQYTFIVFLVNMLSTNANMERRDSSTQVVTANNLSQEICMQSGKAVFGGNLDLLMGDMIWAALRG